MMSTGKKREREKKGPKYETEKKKRKSKRNKDSYLVRLVIRIGLLLSKMRYWLARRENQA